MGGRGPREGRGLTAVGSVTASHLGGSGASPVTWISSAVGARISSCRRPRRSVWSTPHSEGTLRTQRRCTFISQPGGIKLRVARAHPRSHTAPGISPAQTCAFKGPRREQPAAGTHRSTSCPGAPVRRAGSRSGRRRWGCCSCAGGTCACSGGPGQRRVAQRGGEGPPARQEEALF